MKFGTTVFCSCETPLEDVPDLSISYTPVRSMEGETLCKDCADEEGESLFEIAFIPLNYLIPRSHKS